MNIAHGLIAIAMVLGTFALVASWAYAFTMMIDDNLTLLGRRLATGYLVVTILSFIFFIGAHTA